MSAAAVSRIEGLNVVPRSVRADSGQRPEPGRPRRLVLRVCACARDTRGALASRLETDALFGVVQGDGGNVVVPELNPDGVMHLVAADTREAAVRNPRTRREAVIDLLHLVAVLRIVKEEGEVRDEVQVVLGAVAGDLRQRRTRAALPFADDAVA